MKTRKPEDEQLCITLYTLNIIHDTAPLDHKTIRHKKKALPYIAIGLRVYWLYVFFGDHGILQGAVVTWRAMFLAHLAWFCVPLHICCKTQSTAIHSSHVIHKYVLKYAHKIRQICQISETYMDNVHTYVPYMKPLQSTMWEWALSIYDSEQIWLPHCT